jgi:hypothetical protein
MGAYENPQAVIDTGTPQILANAIGSFGKQVAGVLDQEKQRLIAEEKARKDWLKYTFEFSMNEYDKAHEQMIANGAATAEGFNLLNPLINNSTSLKLQAAKATTPEEQAAYLKQANDDQAKIRAYLVGEKGKNAAIEDFKEDFGNNPGLAGQEGGIPLAGAEDKKYVYAMAIAGGFNEGKQEQFWDPKTKDWKIKFTSKSIANDPLIKGDSVIWSKRELAGYDLGKLTNIKNKQFKLLTAKSEKNPEGLGIIDKDGNLSPGFFNPEVKEIKEFKKDGVTYRTVIHPYNKTAIENVLKPKLRAEAIGLLANPSQAQKDWENTLGKNKGELAIGSDSGNNNIFSKEANEAFINAYVDRGLAEVPTEYQPEPAVIVPKDAPSYKPPSEGSIKREAIQKNVDTAYKALFVDKILEQDYKDGRGNVAKLGGQTISSLGESGMTKQLQKIGLQVQRTQTAGEGEDVIKRYKILNPKIPGYYQEIRTDETLDEVVNKLYNATGLGYEGIIDPAEKASKLP